MALLLIAKRLMENYKTYVALCEKYLQLLTILSTYILILEITLHAYCYAGNTLLNLIQWNLSQAPLLSGQFTWLLTVGNTFFIPGK